MDIQPISVTKVNQAGSRVVILEMPDDMAAILLLRCEDGEWIGHTPLYITMDGLETLREALNHFMSKWRERE